MEYESHSRISDGACYYPQLFGAIMITAALLGLSTSYFGGIGVHYLPYLWTGFGSLNKPEHKQKRVRVYMDGCFDLMHYGHANALRQAKLLGDELVVGVVSDEEILANKGPPVLSMEERGAYRFRREHLNHRSKVVVIGGDYLFRLRTVWERLALVGGLKWVDEVIPNAPYAITEQFMKTLFDEYKIDYIIHGDDPCLLPDGTDAYALAKKAGRYKQIKRTEGVSSTDIVGRILSTIRDTNVNNDPGFGEELYGKSQSCKSVQSNAGHLSHFLPTSKRIVQFSNGKGPAPNARVVYIDGAFDLFHAGHVEILRAARQLGDFLLVGIYTDQTVSDIRGPGYPLMNLHERCLSVLGCRYVDEIIMGAPWEVTQDMIKTFNISLVVRGTVSEANPLVNDDTDPYAVPKKMKMFRMLESPKHITTSSVAHRIITNHEVYKKRNAKKVASEKKYYQEKIYVSGD